MISNFTKGRRGHYSEKIIDSILEESLNKPWTAPVSVDTFVLFHEHRKEDDMSGQRYTPEFKDEAVKQVLDRGYSVAEVSERLGVTPHSLYKWVNAF